MSRRGPKYKSNKFPRKCSPALGMRVTDGETGWPAFEGECQKQRGQYRDVRRFRLDIDPATNAPEK